MKQCSSSTRHPEAFNIDSWEPDERALSTSMTMSRAIELVIPVLRAVVCAHAMGIIHRDLKPENILLRNDGTVKVLDFGISKPVATEAATGPLPHSADESENVISTQTGAILGTMPYMSPEQWRHEPLDACTDIWALGIILFELLTGAHPLAPLSMRQLSTVKDVEAALPSLREKRPDAGALGDVVDRCLKKRKQERYSLAAELLDALESIRHAKPSVALTDDESPFAGLAAFQESDAARFFGRDHDVATVIGKLRNQELLVITGSSGAGKSSFVRAGVIPAFKRAHEGVDSFVVRPGRKPLVALADVLAHDGDSETIAQTLATQPGYLGARLRELCKHHGNDHCILLFVDQFEELYTLGTELSERLAFCACLLGVADDASSPLRVVIGIRSDFLERLTEDRAFLATATAGLLFLPPLTREGLGDALKKAKLWEVRDKEARLLTRAGCQTLGGVAGALSMHADAVIFALSTREQRLARAILMRLVTPERTRAIVHLDELGGLDEDDRAVEQVIHHLAGARLIMVDSAGEGDGKTLEIVHELLIDRWGKLRQWLDEDEHDALFSSRLRNAAQQWEKAGETEGLLWRDRSALEAGQWLERRRVDRNANEHLNDIAVFSPDGKRFITWGISNVARAWNADGSGTPIELRGHKRVILAAAWSPDGKRIATASYDNTARVWFADGHGEPAVFQGDEEAINHVTFSPDGKLIATAGWDSTVRIFSVYGERPPIVLLHRARVLSVHFNADGNRVFSASWDHTLRVWNIAGIVAPVIRKAHDSPVSSAMWSPDGRRIVSAGYDKIARIFFADGNGEPIEMRGHEKRLYTAAFSPDGQRIVTASADKTVRVWNADDGRPLLIFRHHDDEVNTASFSPDGKRILTASTDKTARIWNADGTGEPLVFRGHTAALMTATWSHDGTRFISGAEDFTARVWNANGTGEPVILRGHTNGVRWAAFSPDDKRIVTAGYDNIVRNWKSDGTGEPIVLRPFDGGINWAGWSADGRRIFTTDQGKLLRMWNADGTGESITLHRSAGWLKASDLSPNGQQIVVSSWDGTIAILSDLERLSGPNDSRLWTASTYCLSVEQRMKSLGVSEDIAKADLDACLRRVAEARAATLH